MWNHEEFEVQYSVLRREVCIGGVFARHLLSDSAASSDQVTHRSGH